MDFGIFHELSVPRPFGGEATRSVFNNALEQTRLADTIGFNSCWIVEHHFLEEYSFSSCPEMFLAACAAITKQIRLGFGIATCVPEMHHAAILAERAAYLDVLSNGRAEFGTGRSSTWNELGGFGADPASTKKTWDEYVRAIPKMWMQDRARFDGQYVKMPERAVLPKPIQKPHPPMGVAVNAPGTEVDAGLRGLGCLTVTAGNLKKNAPRFATYRKLIKNCEPVGAFVNEKVAAVNWMFCHEDRRYAQMRMRRLVQNFSSMAAQTVQVSQAYPSSNYGAPGLLGALRVDPDDESDKPIPDGLCAGDPADLIATIKAWEAAGVDEIIFMINSRESIPQEEVMNSLRLFEKEVLPAFKNGGSIKVVQKDTQDA